MRLVMEMLMMKLSLLGQRSIINLSMIRVAKIWKCFFDSLTSFVFENRLPLNFRLLTFTCVACFLTWLMSVFRAVKFWEVFFNHSL